MRQRLREYLSDFLREPEFRTRTVVLAVTACVLVVLSLSIDQTAENEAEARHLGFGYPVHFAESDFTSRYTPPGYPQTYGLNPWEIPVEINPFAFLASSVAVYVGLLSSWLLLRSGMRLAWRATVTHRGGF